MFVHFCIKTRCIENKNQTIFILKNQKKTNKKIYDYFIFQMHCPPSGGVMSSIKVAQIANIFEATDTSHAQQQAIHRQDKPRPKPPPVTTKVIYNSAEISIIYNLLIFYDTAFLLYGFWSFFVWIGLLPGPVTARVIYEQVWFFINKEISKK